MNVTKKQQKKSKSNGGPKPLPGGPRIGLTVLLGAMLCVSVLAGLRFEGQVRVFVAGEIATHDVTAGQDLLIEDTESTLRKRDEVAQAQPPVFDLNRDVALEVEKHIGDMFGKLNEALGQDKEKVRWQISEELNAEIPSFIIDIWESPEFQGLVLGPLLPWIKDFINSGMVAEKRLVLPYKQGIVVRDLATGEERILSSTADVRDMNDLRQALNLLLKRDLGKPLRIRKAVLALVMPLVSPSLTLNQETSLHRRMEVMDAVEPVYYKIKEGEIIVRQGEHVTPDQQFKLQALFSHRAEYFSYPKAAGLFVLGMLLILGLYLSHWASRRKVFADRDAVFMSAMLLSFALGAKTLELLKGPLAEGFVFLNVRPELFPFLLPVAGAAGVMAMFFPYNMCFFATLILSFVCSVLGGGDLGLFVYYFVSGIFYVFFLKRAQTRKELLSSIFPLLGAFALIWLGVSFYEFKDAAWVGEGAVASFVNSLLSLCTVLSLSFVVEMVFGYTSRFKLLELMNLEQPLLQDLMVNAPGTYHHSLVVSNMVEAAARAVGANPILAKVGALYHDIGKLKQPQYFIENQYGAENKHDKLAPSMSALILISHVKKGVELARQHKLGPELTDIIRQHHGTSLIAYFYKKAQEQAESRGEEAVREEDYRYPGPKPQTKEAGLILLADAIEASSRTLVEPTPARIKGHINNLIRSIFTEGQLDESELTLKDLHQANEAFHRILTGIFHQRIEYPDQQKQESEKQKQESGKSSGEKNAPVPPKAKAEAVAKGSK